MAEALKYLFYKPEVFKDLGERIKVLYPSFNADAFAAHFYSNLYKEMELKAKMVYGATVLHKYLPANYEQALSILEQASVEVKGFVATTFPEYVAAYGLEFPERSLQALKKFTVLCSSEFGIRPFIKQYPDQALAMMLNWAGDENEHVRRLASEGCRPRLPWGMALKKLQKDPQAILPILEKLHTDGSEYVRRSVANNLNDISKDHPQLVLEICKRWQGESKDVDRLIKHACRTMLKAGRTDAMVLFGFATPNRVLVTKFYCEPATIQLGDRIFGQFTLKILDDEIRKIRLEYAIDFVKANGRTSSKVFQIKEADYAPGEHVLKFSQLFANLTTRKHYAGVHCIALLVNGQEKASVQIELKI